jgi:hypothetical protein
MLFEHDYCKVLYIHVHVSGWRGVDWLGYVIYGIPKGRMG